MAKILHGSLSDMPAKAQSVEDFIKSLPEDRQLLIKAVRKTVLSNLPEGYAEIMLGSLIYYVVPHSIYPAGYHCNPKTPLPLAALASQKNYAALHLMAVYGDAETEKWFRKEWGATGKKLDMGKACVRLKKLEDVPLDVIGRLFARIPCKAYIARIEKFVEMRSRKGK